MRKTKRLLDEYRFPGYRPVAKIKGKFGDSKARIIQLVRHQKKRKVAAAEQFIEAIMTAKYALFVIYHVGACGFIWKWKYAALNVRNAVK